MDSTPKISSHQDSFRLFSYLSMTILSVSIIVGLFIIFQHLEEEKEGEKFVANQETLLENQQLLLSIASNIQNGSQQSIENQQLLKALGEDAKGHEMREEDLLGNNTKTNINISSSNSERLNLILEALNVTIPKSLQLQ